MCFLVIWSNRFIRKLPDISALVFLNFILLSGFNACQKQSYAEEIIIGNYYVRYTAADSLLNANTHFYKEQAPNKKIPVTFLGGIHFMRKKMNFDRQDDAYSTSIQKLWVENINFSFQNTERKPINFSSTLKAVKFRKPPAVINKRKNLRLQLEPSALRDRESVGILIVDAAQKTTATFFEGPRAGEFYEVPVSNLKELAEGTGSLYLIKRKEIKEQHDGFLHQMLIEYYSEPVSVYISEE